MEMSREILFKGQRKSDRAWIYGNLLRTDDGIFIIQNHVPYHLLEKYEVLEETVCEYTGLTDINKNKIWENDIVSVEHTRYEKESEEDYMLLPETVEYTRNYAIEFVNKGGHCGYRCRNKSIHFAISGNTVYNHKITVIGNIFDNPELLEGGEAE